MPKRHGHLLPSACNQESGSDNQQSHSFCKGASSVCGYYCAPCNSGYSRGKLYLKSDYFHGMFYCRTLLNSLFTLYPVDFTGEYAFPHISKAFQEEGFFLDPKSHDITFVTILEALFFNAEAVHQQYCVRDIFSGLKDTYINMAELLVISTDGLLCSILFSIISRQERSKPLSPEEATDLCRMQCLTTVFLLHMPLSQRAQIRIMKSCWTKQVLPLIKMVRTQLSYFSHHLVHLSFQFSVFLCKLFQQSDEIRLM